MEKGGTRLEKGGARTEGRGQDGEGWGQARGIRYQLQEEASC